MNPILLKFIILKT